MSRHRNIKAAVDDYYDDDYYDDEDFYEEEYYDEQPYSQPLGAVTVQSAISVKTKGKSSNNVKKSGANTASSGVAIVDEASADNIAQILEVLGYDKVSHSSPLGPHISEARVRQMLEAYNDVTRVVEYFMTAAEDTKQHQQQQQKKGTSVSGVARTKSLNTLEVGVMAKGGKAPAVGTVRAGSTPQKLPVSKSSTSLTAEAVVASKTNVKGTPVGGGLSRTISGGSLSTVMRMRCVSEDDISVEQLSAAPTTDADTGIPEMTLVVVGHVDAGKSTLVGNLLLKSGHVQSRTVQKFEKESASIGKSSFYLAWVMDEDESEREHGVTIDIAER
jgi:hypothetical protein